MSGLLVDQGTTGLEEIQREALYVLMDNLNDALADMEAYWAPKDEALALRLGIDYVPTTLEPVIPTNFHEGHRPSLIGAPIDRYPNVAVMCFRAAPSAESAAYDHMESYRDALWVEVMVKSQVSEEECNRRIHRMASAANLCMMAHKTLNGSVSGMDTAPTTNISDLFKRKEKASGYGPEWYWQGARLDYTVRKEAVDPPSTGSFLRTSAPYSIDQA